MKTIIAVIFLVFMIIIGFSIIDKTFDSGDTSTPIVESVSTSDDKENKETIKVIVSGEVENPGTYTVEKGSYLDEVLQLAGGVTSNADYSCFNYFCVLEKDTTLYIAPVTLESKVSINTALLEELTTLEGVGIALGSAIITYRETNGQFMCLEQMMEVKGIGKQIFEKNKDKICL